MKSIFKIFASFSLALIAFSCKKNDPVKKDETFGTVSLQFKNVVGDQALQLNQRNYRNANGDSFEVMKYVYYLTNVEFVREDGTSYTNEDFKFLIDQSKESSLSSTLSNIPSGTYTKIKCTLGIDSIHNVSGAQSGVLDPLHGMFWDWNSGYIMAKVEGYFYTDNTWSNIYRIHLGGFSGQYSSVKNIEIALPQALKVTPDVTPEITFQSDVLKWFNGSSYNVNLSESRLIMSIGEDGYKISENYKHHLIVTEVRN